MQDALLQGLCLGMALGNKSLLDAVRGVDELAFDLEARNLWRLLNDKEKLRDWFASRGIVPKENRPLCEGVLDELGRRGRERTIEEKRRIDETREVLEAAIQRSKVMLSREELVQWVMDELTGKPVAGKVGEAG